MPLAAGAGERSGSSSGARVRNFTVWRPRRRLKVFRGV
jgi:hypothetical protein